MSKIGDFIKTKREEKGLNITALAELSGVSRPYLSQIESGKRKPSSDILNKISKPLGVSPLTLMYKAEYADEDDLQTLFSSESLLKEVNAYKDDDYYYDSTEKQNEKSKEFQAITTLLNINYRGSVKWSENVLLNEVEQVIIREHLSELLGEYKDLIESYISAKVRWGSFRKNFIDIYKNEMSKDDIKELFFKQELEKQISSIKDKAEVFPMWITKQPDFLMAASVKKRMNNEKDNQE